MTQSEIPADVIECGRRALAECDANPNKTLFDIVPDVLRAAGWPELVAERDRLRRRCEAELADHKRDLDDWIADETKAQALITKLAAALREARAWLAPGWGELSNGIARIDALLAKAEGSK